MLLEIGVKLAGTLDLQRVLQLALEHAEQVCRAETSSIWELDEERQQLFFRIVRGTAAQDIRNLRVPVGEGIVGSVALTGKAERINDVSSDGRWRGDSGPNFATRAISVTTPAMVKLKSLLGMHAASSRRSVAWRAPAPHWEHATVSSYSVPHSSPHGSKMERGRS